MLINHDGPVTEASPVSELMELEPESCTDSDASSTYTGMRVLVQIQIYTRVHACNLSSESTHCSISVYMCTCTPIHNIDTYIHTYTHIIRKQAMALAPRVRVISLSLASPPCPVMPGPRWQVQITGQVCMCVDACGYVYDTTQLMHAHVCIYFCSRQHCTY